MCFLKLDLQLRKRRCKIMEVTVNVVQYINLQSSKNSTNFHLQIKHCLHFLRIPYS